MQRTVAARAAVLSLCLLALSGAAHAQLFRSYVSSTGSDANPCTLVAPCRLLPAALTAVASGGEIWMLDSANFNTGPVTIAKSVSILAVPGAVGSVVGTGAGSAPALTVTGATTVVSLRNLRVTLMVGAPLINGVVVEGGARAVIEGGVVAGFGYGVRVTGPSSLQMGDTTVRGNVHGIHITQGGRASLSRVTLTQNQVGALAMADIPGVRAARLEIVDSTISHNTGLGVSVFALVAATVNVAVRSSLISGNSTLTGDDGCGICVEADPAGIATLSAQNNIVSGNYKGVAGVGSTTKIYAASNLVTNNLIGFSSSSATFESTGNILRDNTTQTGGSITGLTTQ